MNNDIAFRIAAAKTVGELVDIAQLSDATPRQIATCVQVAYTMGAAESAAHAQKLLNEIRGTL